MCSENNDSVLEHVGKSLDHAVAFGEEQSMMSSQPPLITLCENPTIASMGYDHMKHGDHSPVKRLEYCF